MKCYEHPKLDAVGICSECGQGVCNRCAVKIGGKLYCKTDADKVFGKPKVADRGAAITLASILFNIFGILGLLSSLVIIGEGAWLGGYSEVSFIGDYVGYASSALIAIGFVALVLSVLEFVAGNWLWKSLRKGGKLGIILVVLSLLLSYSVASIPFVGVIGIISIVVNIFMLLLIVVGWRNLH